MMDLVMNRKIFWSVSIRINTSSRDLWKTPSSIQYVLYSTIV